MSINQLPKFFILCCAVIVGCSTRQNESRIDIVTIRDGATDSNVYISDMGVKITVSWKYPRSRHGKAQLLDGASNVVWNSDYPGPGGSMDADTVDVIAYNFQPQDNTGTWRLVMTFEGENRIDQAFEVLPLQEVPSPEASSAFETLACRSEDGNIILDNFYQMSPAENEALFEYRGVWYWEGIIHQIKVRATLCGAGDLNGMLIDDWEKWLEQVTGKKIRQQHPTVHERVAAVMPVYEEEFLFVDPAFVYWFSETMVPHPDNKRMFGWTYQEIYNRSLREAGRTMALTFLYFNSLPDGGLDAQVQYAEMAAQKYVNQEEERVMTRNYESAIYDRMTEWHEVLANEWMATNVGKEVQFNLNVYELAFWMRRGIDGSANEVWLALREVLKKYDGEWYNTYIDPHWAP